MKIALLGSKDFDSLEYHLHDALKHMGHEVFHMDISDVIKIPYRYNYWASKLFPKYDLSVFKKIAKKIIEQQPEFIICTYRFIHPECIRMIKKNLKNTPVVHINPDQLTTLEYQQIFVSPYDAYFTKDRFMQHFMSEKIDLNAYYLPEAFNSRVHKSPCSESRLSLEQEIDIDVVAFGTMYPYRSKMVEKLIDAGVNVTLFGTPDKRFPNPKILSNFKNEFITGERKANVLFGSKIVFNNFHYAEIESANAKFFEIAGIGGFQICDYKPVLEEYSAINIEDFAFKSIGEAIDKIKFYLDKPKVRHDLAIKQQAHFLEHHTYEARMKDVFNKF